MSIQLLKFSPTLSSEKFIKEQKKFQAANDNLSSDILRGAAEIADFLGFPRRSIYHAASRGNIPTFRIGDLVCARKSTLATWIEEQEATGRAA